MSTDPNQANGAVLCDFCGVEDSTVLFEPGVAQKNRIVRCNRCGLMYANPRAAVDKDLIAEYVDDPDLDLSKWQPQLFEKQTTQIHDYAGTRALLREWHPKRGKLVEVGSSMGLLLKSLRDDGWDVHGVEPDPNACRYATKTFGIPTTAATLEGAKLPSGSADALVMLHVIEHVPSPVETLREVHRVLKPGGTFVLETPRYDTLMFKLLGRRERSLGCDGHIYFFTNETLRRAVELAGFECLRHDAVGRSLTMDRLVYNLGVVSRNRWLQGRLGKLSRTLRLQKLRLHLNFRDMQRVYLRKPLTRPTG